MKRFVVLVLDVIDSVRHGRNTGLVWLPKDLRYVGFQRDWYDGPIYSFGFWFFHVYTM